MIGALVVSLIASSASPTAAAAPAHASPTRTVHIAAGPAETQLVIDLNQATLDDLTRLPGIGPKRAEAILARRTQQPFTRVTQLLEVRGIGKKTLERLKPHLRVGAPAARAAVAVH